MNKGIVIGGFAILILIGGGLFFANQQTNSGKMTQQKAEMVSSGESMEEKTQMEKDDTTMQKSNGRYIEYSKATLDETSGNRRVLYFYANWCPTCRPADANFKENMGRIPDDVTVIRVNYNDTDTDQEERDLATKYGITYQHTFVQIDKDGNQVTKWNGGQIEELLKNIK